MIRLSIFIPKNSFSIILLALLLSFTFSSNSPAKKLKVKVVKKAVKEKKALTATQIIDRLDQNMVFGSRRAHVIMMIHRRGRTRSKTMKIFSKGTKTSYSEFLSPARDKGIKYLKKGDSLWMYLPSAEKIIKISGHMLRQSMMGSDFSYEDMLDSNALRQRYSFKVIKTEKMGGHMCYVILMKQKKKGETYPTRKIWVSKKNFVTRRSELFALSGQLLKIMIMSKIKNYGNRFYPTVIMMKNKLRRKTWTKMIMTNIVFKVKLPRQVFSLSNLDRED